MSQTEMHEESLPNQSLVRDFVLAAHSNLRRVIELYEEEPRLLDARYEEFSETALDAAGHMGNREIALFLLERGALPTIFSAAMLGNVAEVEAFVLRAPDLVNASGVHGISLMYHAALSGNVEVAQMLYDRGCRLGLGSALHAAVSREHVQMLLWLLDRPDLDTEARNIKGQTPIQVAEELGYHQLARLLRQHVASRGIE